MSNSIWIALNTGIDGFWAVGNDEAAVYDLAVKAIHEKYPNEDFDYEINADEMIEMVEVDSTNIKFLENYNL